MEEELNNASDALKTIAEWYEDEGYNADFYSLDNKLNDLSAAFTAIESRINKHNLREESTRKFFETMNKTKNDAMDMLNRKPWIDEHFNNNFTKKFESILDAFSQLHHDQTLLPLNQVKNKNLTEFRIRF